MDLDFSSEQEMLRDSALKFLANECPYSKVKEIEDSQLGYSPELWTKLTELGWLGLLFPENYGGYGGQFMDLIIIQEAMGRAVFPSPFFSTVIQAGLIILDGGSENQKMELLPQIAEGSLILSLAQYEEDGSFRLSDINLKAEVRGGQYILNGTKLFVMNANVADKLIAAVRTEKDEISLLLIDTANPGLTINRIPTIGKDNCCEVIFKEVFVPQGNIVGAPGEGARILEGMNLKAAVAKAAEMVGACKACIDITADYARQREQYGKPIGGFQAIQHYMANMMVEYDTCYNYLYQVAWMVDTGEDYTAAASGLKACVNQAYNYISERAIQIHGAIGTTREGAIGLFYRKAKAAEYICGDSEFLYEKVIEKLLETDPVLPVL